MKVSHYRTRQSYKTNFLAPMVFISAAVKQNVYVHYTCRSHNNIIATQTVSAAGIKPHGSMLINTDSKYQHSQP